MTYVAWSVVFGEQPSAAKWNILGTNDASFNDGSGLNNISNPITASSGSHLELVAGTNKLVKTTVLRQDNTSNTYQSGNSVILTGWGYMTPGAASAVNETVTFGVTFVQRPIVILTAGGDTTTATTTLGSGVAAIKAFHVEAHTVTATSFVAHVWSTDATNWAANNTVYYHWIAIGELA